MRSIILTDWHRAGLGGAPHTSDPDGGGGNKAERMMAGMGFRHGDGLGKQGDGVTQAIVATGNIGALGLGYGAQVRHHYCTSGAFS